MAKDYWDYCGGRGLCGCEAEMLRDELRAAQAELAAALANNSEALEMRCVAVHRKDLARIEELKNERDNWKAAFERKPAAMELRMADIDPELIKMAFPGRAVCTNDLHLRAEAKLDKIRGAIVGRQDSLQAIIRIWTILTEETP